MVRGFIAAALAVTLASIAAPAGAELATWDQERVTRYAKELLTATEELQGSLNGQTWQTLRAHQGDESLASQSMSTAAWPVNAGAQAFRHFRILQTGANSSGNHFLKCTGIELYGRANFQPHA